MVKGESISYRDIEPRESKIPLLPINPHEYMSFSVIHDDDDDDGESNLGKLNKDDEKFLKNYVEKKKWIFKNKGNSCEFDDLYDISEDEKEIKKQEKFEAEFSFDYVIPKPVGMYSGYKKHRTEGELKKVKSGISWQRLLRKIKKGERVCDSDIEPCESKLLLLPISSHKYMDFSGIHDEYDRETEMRKLNKKKWVFKNKRKNREFDDVDSISEDEKEITKQEKFEAEFNCPCDLHEYALKPEPEEEKGDRMQVVEVNGDTGKSSKKRRRNGGLEEGKPSKQRRKAYGLGNIGTKKKKKKNLYQQW